MEDIYNKAGSTSRRAVEKAGAEALVSLDGVAVSTPVAEMTYSRIIGSQTVMSAVDAVRQVMGAACRDGSSVAHLFSSCLAAWLMSIQ